MMWFSLSLLSYALLSITALADSTVPGRLNLYDDFDCNQISTLNPTVNLALSTCLVTTGGEGLAIELLPPCPSSTASLIYYSDTACGVQYGYTISTTGDNDSCKQLAAGTDLIDIHSVMFSCQPKENNPQPSSTTTAIVSAIPVATGSSQGSGSGSTTSATGPEGTSASTPKPTNTSSSGNSTGNSDTGSGTTSSSSSGLSTSDIIAIAVGLGVGIPSIVIAILTWQFPKVTTGWWEYITSNHNVRPQEHESQRMPMQGADNAQRYQHYPQAPQYSGYPHPPNQTQQYHPMSY
ncbi:hypothetical protein MMC14_010163 [Varicellaria rhodocarpa]|nr:hypothetical protein [Varicellaria rhodocarpa]